MIYGIQKKSFRQFLYLKKRPHLHACHTQELWIKNEVELKQPKHLQVRTGQIF